MSAKHAGLLTKHEGMVARHTGMLAKHEALFAGHGRMSAKQLKDFCQDIILINRKSGEDIRQEVRK